MKINDFEFEANDLSYMTLEEEICDRCEVCAINDSNLPPFLKVNEYYKVRISAQNCNISCNAVICENSKSENGYKYLFCISCIDIKHTK